MNRAERVDEAVERWHESDPVDQRPLSEALGWTPGEYARWVEACELPPEREGAA